MSRVAKSPISILDGVNVELLDNAVNVKGKLGELSFELPESISIEIEDSTILVKYNEDIQSSVALGGTTRSLINNMILGVSSGFEKKLELKGVGYRAKASGKLLELTLGFSHPVKYQLPEEVNVETPSQTEIILKSHNKQILGQADNYLPLSYMSIDRPRPRTISFMPLIPNFAGDKSFANLTL
jgi:large subunit ribosomal protein L6